MIHGSAQNCILVATCSQIVRSDTCDIWPLWFALQAIRMQVTRAIHCYTGMYIVCICSFRWVTGHIQFLLKFLPKKQKNKPWKTAVAGVSFHQLETIFSRQFLFGCHQKPCYGISIRSSAPLRSYNFVAAPSPVLNPVMVTSLNISRVL